MNGTLYADLSLLDPRNFEEINKDGLPDMALQELSTCLLGFNSEATMKNLLSELKNLAAHWDKLKQSHLSHTEQKHLVKHLKKYQMKMKSMLSLKSVHLVEIV